MLRPRCRSCFIDAQNVEREHSTLGLAQLDPATFDPFHEYPNITDWCEHCDRVALRIGSKRRSRNFTACSPECENALRNAARHVARAQLRCTVCRNAFTPKRSDARYCSNACRQDAYRKRKLL